MDFYPVSFFLLLILSQGYSIPTQSNGKSVCTSPDCVLAAKRISENMDTTADPCQNFYQFACGRFPQNYPLKEGQTNRWGMLLLLEELVERATSMMGDKNLKNHGSAVIRKAKDIYDKCMSAEDNVVREIAMSLPEESERIDGQTFIPNLERQQHKVSHLTEDKRLQCIKVVKSKYKHAVTRIYLDNYFSPKDNNASRELLMRVINEFKEFNPPWSTDKMRKKVQEKLQKLIIRIGYPEWMTNNQEFDKEYDKLVSDDLVKGNLLKSNLTSSSFKSDREEGWEKDVLTVNAWYNPKFLFWGKEKVTVPAGILHRQVFNRNLPKYLNYGAAGFILGHEMSHAMYDWTRQTWFPPKHDSSRGDLGCVAEQLESIKEPTTGWKYRPGDGWNHTQEALADVGSINFTLAAMENDKDNGFNIQLPGLTHLTPQQLFFLSEASAWCYNGKEEWIRDFFNPPEGWVPFNVHPFPYHRVLLPAMNSQDFAKAFQCKAGSPMNPVKKCVIW